MNRSFFFFFALVALLGLCPQISSAYPITPPQIYEVAGGTHGYNSVGNNGESISYGTVGGVPGRMVNGVFQPYSRQNGWTNFVAGHPSANGQLGVFQASCGGVICSVVYNNGVATTFQDMSLYQVGNGGELAGQDANGQPIKLSLSNPVPVQLPTGTDVGALVAAVSLNGVAVGTTFNADGTSSQASVWASDGTLKIIAASTSQAGLLGVSNNGNWGTGFDGGFASVWDLLNNIQYRIRDSLGNLIPGAGLTVLNDGSAAGDAWVATLANNRVAIDPCIFLTNAGANVPVCQDQDPGSRILRFTLAQNPLYANLVGVGGNASLLAGTVDASVVTGEAVVDVINTPELPAWVYTVTGLLALGTVLSAIGPITTRT